MFSIFFWMVCVNLFIFLILVVIIYVLLEFSAILADMCKYTFRKAKFMQPTLVGYWVTLFLITDGLHTFTMFNQDEWLDNALLMSESTSVQSFTQDILVTPDMFPTIFSEIQDFVNNVSQSNFN